MSFTITSNSCCVCLAETVVEESNSIFEKYYDGTVYSDIYECCTGYTLNRANNVLSPVRICNSCDNCLVQLYEFRRTCETSENILEYINKIIHEKLESITINIASNGNNEDVYSIDSYVVSETTKIKTSVDDIEFKITPLEDMYDVIPVNITTKPPKSIEEQNSTKIKNDDIHIRANKIPAQNHIENVSNSKPQINNNLGEFSVANIIEQSNIHNLKVVIDRLPNTTNYNIGPSNNVDNKKLLSVQLNQLEFEKNRNVNRSTKETIEKTRMEISHDDEMLENTIWDDNISKESKSGRKKVVASAIRKWKQVDIRTMRKIQCEKCGKLLPVKYRKTHMLQHEEKRPEDIEKKFVCQICDKKYKNKCDLVKHRRLHTGEKRYECPYCDKKFMIWNTRKLHVDKDHTGISRFDCHLCNKQFFHGSARRLHIRKHHVNEQKFACDLCDKRFTQAYELKDHMNVHSNIRNYVCEVCNKAFFHRKGLRVHKKTHTDINRYQCPVCGRGYVMNYLLRYHIQKSHPNIELPPLGTTLTPEVLEELNGTIFKNISNVVELTEEEI